MAGTAFLFAGQGAQTPGMAAETRGNQKVDRLFALADKVLPGMTELMLSGTKEQLGITVNTQPCMFIADLAYAYAAESDGLPSAVCGFSVGEVPALAYAEAVSVEDGMRIIAKRAQLMQEACERTGGAMIAVIGLSSDKVEEIAAAVGDAWAVNYNCPTQTVVAVTGENAEKLTAAVKESGGRAIRLAVSGAFHCPLLGEAADKLREFLRGIDFSAPRMPVYANLTAKPYEGDFADLLARQMCSPVRFCLTVQNMRAAGIDAFIEVGPGKVLTGLVGKIPV